MTKSKQEFVVNLTDGIYARTPIPSENHPALRSGFAGYPTNPRWSATKFGAWKLGRKWRSLLAADEIVVRSSDSMLIPKSAIQTEVVPESQQQVSKDEVKFRHLQLV